MQIENTSSDGINSEYEENIRKLQKWQTQSHKFLVEPWPLFQIILFMGFAVLVVGLPLQVVFNGLVEGAKPLNISELSIPFETLYYLISLIFLILMGINNIAFVRTFSQEFQKFETIRAELETRGEESKQLDITKTEHYKLVGRIEIAYLAGTLFAGGLWFLMPDKSRLEPLTIIYGIGTAIFEYYRIKLNIPNPLDRLIESE